MFHPQVLDSLALKFMFNGFLSVFRYYETSAMNGEGILKMFCEVLEVASANVPKGQSGILGT